MNMQALRTRAREHGLKAVLTRSATALGFDLVKRSFYSPIPDWRAMPDEVWTRRSALEGIAWDLEAQVRFVQADLAPFTAEFTPPVDPPVGAPTYSYRNGFFGAVDSDILYAMVRHLRPRRIIELGSGYSSLVVAQARGRNDADLPGAETCQHTVWDPFARPELKETIAAAADLRLVSANDVPLATFDELQAGDVLFVDTTHTVKLDSDVNRIILDVLPRLRPGVVVHFHDIFLPWEYPKQWLVDPEVFWAEQYLLQAFLTGNRDWDVMVASAALYSDEPDRLAAVFPSTPLASGASSFWMRRRERC